MKIGKNMNPSYFLATDWNLQSNSVDLELFFPLKSGEFGTFFFSHEKAFVMINIIFFRLKFGENSPVKETLA